jgi:succinate-semialdehyde dehydrogenase/glutarate-semialdehyde dehydrogenase
MEYSITINPATGEEITKYERLTTAKIQEKITIADTAYSLWKNKTFEERAVFMNRLYNFEENKEEYAQLATREMGKVIAVSQRNRKYACRQYC